MEKPSLLKTVMSDLAQCFKRAGIILASWAVILTLFYVVSVGVSLLNFPNDLMVALGILILACVVGVVVMLLKFAVKSIKKIWRIK